MMSRLMLSCGEAKRTTMEWWSSLQPCVREQTIGKRLRRTTGRLMDATGAACSQGILRVRNTMERMRRRADRREGDYITQTRKESETSRHSFNQDISVSHRQPLQINTKPLNYLEKCSNKEPAGGGSLDLVSSTPCNDQHGKGAYKKGTGDKEIGRKVVLTGSHGKGRNEVAGGTLAILMPPFSDKDLEEYLMRAIHSKDLNDQLEKVPLGDETRSKGVATLPCNKKKNRYKNNIPYDDTRVVLKDLGDADYINASYISSSLDERRFIAAQGPKGANERTVEDFWLMVWQNNTNVIIMMANLIEDGREKVSQYWPDTTEEMKNYGKVKVLMTAEKKLLDYTVRHFLVSMNSHSRNVVQYQYTTWPDHLVPDSPVGVSLMIHDVCKRHWTGPPVIHCSAGLGRSGTILLVLSLLRNLHTEGQFHPPDTLLTLRMCRANLLDNQLQYRFAHYVLLEVLFGYKIRYPIAKLADKDFLASIKSDLHKQFQELKSFPTGLTYDWARRHDPKLNRNNSVLPADGRQVPLIMLEDQAGEQYMNAVRVRDLSLRETFLVTEHPMIHTVSRAWRLAYMTEASAWVFLHDHSNLPDEEDFPSVLLFGGRGELTGITLKVNEEIKKRFYTETSVTVSQLVSHTMLVIQFKNWHPSEETPFQVESLIALFMRLEELQRARSRKIMMVSCSDGYSASGVLVTLARLAADVRLTQRVNVFHNVLSVLFDRPQFIKSKEQYFYLYKAVLAYHQTIVGARRRTQANVQEMTEQVRKEKQRGAYNARDSDRKLYNRTIVQRKKSLMNYEREIHDKEERKKEQKEMEIQIVRKSETGMKEEKWMTVDMNKEKEGMKKDGARESYSRKREDVRKREVLEILKNGNSEQSKVEKGEDTRGGVKEEPRYECVWLGEVQRKKGIYEHIWEARGTQCTPNEDKET